MEITGFKNAQETRRFEFGAKNHILGDNGKGKTSIGEAIVFCLFGTSYNGEVRRNDDLINVLSDEATVELGFRDDYGNNHVLKRTKSKQSQQIELDGREECTQSDINAIVGEPDFFLSMFNLIYFNDLLDARERRALFLKYSPIVDMVGLFRGFADESLIDKYEIQIHQPNDYKRLNKMRNDTERIIGEHRHEIQILQQQDVAETATRKQFELNKNEELYKIEEALKVLDQRLSELVVQPLISVQADAANVEILTMLNSVSFMSEPSFVDLSTNESCPICYSSITEEHRAHIAEYQQKELEKAREHNSKVTQIRQILTEKQHQRLQEIEQHNKQAYADSAEKARLENEFNRLVQLKEQLTSSVSPFETQQNQRKNRLAYLNKSIGELQIQYSELESVCAAMSPSLGIFRKAVEVKADYLKNELKRCSMVLERAKKNGETEECFDIFFDEKPYRRLSYSEKMLCSMEIAKFLRNKSEKNIPMFVDNAESISKIPPELIEGIEQLFLCVVVKDADLSCTPV